MIYFIGDFLTVHTAPSNKLPTAICWSLFLQRWVRQYKHPILYLELSKILDTNLLVLFDRNHKYKISEGMFLGHVQMSPNVQNLSALSKKSMLESGWNIEVKPWYLQQRFSRSAQNKVQDEVQFLSHIFRHFWIIIRQLFEMEYHYRLFNFQKWSHYD